MPKKIYKAPSLRAVNIRFTEILAGSLNGDINTGGGDEPTGNSDHIWGYDKDNGGWGTGSPD